MIKFVKNVSLAASLVLAGAIGASAATLSISGGSAVTLGNNFNPAPDLSALIDVGDEVTNFSGQFAGQGLSVNGTSDVTVTFLGKEAGYVNFAMETLDGQMLADTTPGQSITFTQNAGLISFAFKTLGTNPAGVITNGVGGTSEALDMAFSAIFNGGKSVIALFGDGGGNNDNDRDDMVVRIDVVPVPLPAGGLLLLTALGGVAAIRRRKRAL